MRRFHKSLIASGAFWVLISSGAGAQAATPLDALFACRDLPTGQARADCLDRESAALEAAVAAGALRVVETNALLAEQEADFGLNRAGRADALAETAEGRHTPGTALAGAPAAPDAAGTVGPSAQAAPSRAIRGQDGRIEAVSGAPVAALERDAYGKLRIRLDNGQLWRQVDSRQISLPAAEDMETLTAEIRRGWLGSFFMELSHSGPGFRARREE